jgi:uncharacterized protein (DUF697 family)
MAETTQATGTQATETRSVDERLDDAQRIVQRNVYWAMGGGVLPLPLVDIVAITAVQLKMLRELPGVYKVPFREGAAKKAVTSLLVGIGGVGVGAVIGASFAKFIPVVGQSLGIATVPAVSGALTHAVGHTFILHFESGGTLLDFNAKAMRKYFEEEFGKAKETVKAPAAS